MFPYYYRPTTPSDSDYLRALAEERAAREQYAAARRAQEEARQRAARARAARRAYGSPHSSYLDDGYVLGEPVDYDMDLGLDDAGAYYSRPRPVSYAGSSRPYGFGGLGYGSPTYAYGIDPYQQRALLEEQRRKELLEEQKRRELLELEREKERRRLEEERIRKILQEERQREEEAIRQRMLEEERMRRAVEEEKLRRAMEEERMRRALREEEEARRERQRSHGAGHLRSPSQQASLEPLLRALGFVPATSGSDSESDKETPRGRPSQGPRRNVPSPSPIRPYPFGRPSQRSEAAPASTIPITSPKSAAKPKPIPKPTEEQIAAAEKIQDAYRAYSARKQALNAVANLRRRFLAARNGFTLPSSLDYDVSTDGRATTSVSVDPASMRDLPSPSALEAEDPFENVPRLAYTPTNAQHHAYEEELNRILNALDAVESHGDLGVRGARRELARAVEREADRVERWRAVVWKWWTQREAEKEKAAAAPAQPEAQPAAEPAEVKMDVEPPEQPAQQTTATAPEPTPTTTTTDAAPMEVEPTPASSAESAPTTQAPVPEPSPSVVQAAESPAPEVDIPDADAAAVESQLAPPQIVVQPPSREEPQSESDSEPPVPETQPQQSSAPTTAAPAPDVANPAPESPVQPQPEATERPATPALSHEGEGDMEVEPEEAMTPPPGTPTPFVAVDSGSPDHPQETKVPQVQQQPHQDEPMHKRPPHPTVVDEAEEELREHEMLQ